MYFTGCDNRSAFQDLFSTIYLFVFLDGFIIRARRDCLLSRSCLDQHPVVLESGDVLNAVTQWKRHISGGYNFLSRKEQCGHSCLYWGRDVSLQRVIQRKSLEKKGGTFPCSSQEAKRANQCSVTSERAGKCRNLT